MRKSSENKMLSNSASKLKMEWLTISPDELIMRKPMYWYKINKKLEIKDDQKEITLHVPLKNILNQATLHKMIELLAKEEEIPNEL